MGRLSISVVLAVLAACGGDGIANPVDDPPGNPVDDPQGDPPAASVESDSIVVPAEGGTFSLLDGDLELRIPPGAATAGTPIIVTRDTSADASGRAVPDAVFDFAPDGLVFDSPVELTVRIDPARLSEADLPELVRLHRFVDGEPRLVAGSRLDRDEAVLAGFVDGFSAYGAAQAEVEEVVEADRGLADAVASFDSDLLERIQEAVAQDVETILPFIESDCRGATFLNVKERFFRQRSSMANTLELVGLDETVVPSKEAFCGGLLAPGASTLEVEPGPWVRVEPGEQIQLSASVVGPEGERLFGEMIWFLGDPVVAGISFEEGLLVGVEPGVTYVDAASVDFPLDLVSRVEVVVAADLLVEVVPAEPVLATGQRLEVEATVTDTTTGRVLGPDEVSLAWTTGNAEIVASPFVPGAPAQTITLEGRAPGTTSLTACVFHRDEASGLVTEHSCSADRPVEVVYSVAGEWIFNESLTVDVDPPATERCQIVGTAQLDQDGREVSGTISEQATCTFDPGDGTGPEIESFNAQGRVFQGSVGDRDLEFVIEVTLPGDVIEQCRWTGSFDGAEGVALLAVGFVQCLDEDGFLSEGPSEGRRAGAGIVSPLGDGSVQGRDDLDRPPPLDPDRRLDSRTGHAQRSRSAPARAFGLDQPVVLDDLGAVLEVDVVETRPLPTPHEAVSLEDFDHGVGGTPSLLERDAMPPPGIPGAAPSPVDLPALVRGGHEIDGEPPRMLTSRRGPGDPTVDEGVRDVDVVDPRGHGRIDGGSGHDVSFHPFERFGDEVVQKHPVIEEGGRTGVLSDLIFGPAPEDFLDVGTKAYRLARRSGRLGGPLERVPVEDRVAPVATVEPVTRGHPAILEVDGPPPQREDHVVVAVGHGIDERAVRPDEGADSQVRAKRVSRADPVLRGTRRGGDVDRGPERIRSEGRSLDGGDLGREGLCPQPRCFRSRPEPLARHAGDAAGEQARNPEPPTRVLGHGMPRRDHEGSEIGLTC